MILPAYYNRLQKRGWKSNGYRFLSTPDRGEIAEHRYLMEKYVGRILGVDEVVHHKNGNKTDNRLENLEIIARGRHTSIHRGHKNPCLICGVDDPKGSLGLCGMHRMRVSTYMKKYGITDPKDHTPRAVTVMGVAWAMENPEVLLRVGDLYGKSSKA
jgi:hypothetical protein